MLQVASLQTEVETLREMLLSEGICPNCFSRGSIREDRESGDLFCTECGLTVPVFSPLTRIPGVGAETNYAPENRLCHGRDLGNTGVNSRGKRQALFKVLKKRSLEHLPIRAIQVLNEVKRSEETTITERMKTYLSKWSKQFGWEKHHIFGNSLGYHAEWVGGILSAMKDGSNSKDLALGIFIFNVNKIFNKETALMVAQQLKPKKLYVKKARDFILRLKVLR